MSYLIIFLLSFSAMAQEISSMISTYENEIVIKNKNLDPVHCEYMFNHDRSSIKNKMIKVCLRGNNSFPRKLFEVLHQNDWFKGKSPEFLGKISEITVQCSKDNKKSINYQKGNEGLVSFILPCNLVKVTDSRKKVKEVVQDEMDKFKQFIYEELKNKEELASKLGSSACLDSNSESCKKNIKGWNKILEGINQDVLNGVYCDFSVTHEVNVFKPDIETDEGFNYFQVNGTLNGKPHGYWVEAGEQTGEKKTGHYKNGKKIGIWEQRFNGQLNLKEYFNDQGLQYKSEEINEMNGNLMTRYSVKDETLGEDRDLFITTVERYQDDGKTLKEVFRDCQKGIPCVTETYNQQGEIVEKSTMEFDKNTNKYERKILWKKLQNE